ncbi:uncharacterized protein LOC142003767 [Carettochelys insculpta]|uniref:uncharacterized protein LOC142003767 n=1 Tax=Carettochelys insculpta TaxID=44489 RepID=UPI003EB74253
MCCREPLENLPLAQSLQMVEERIQYIFRHLDEVLVPTSMMTFGSSDFSSSSTDSFSSYLWSSSSLSLGKSSWSWSEPLSPMRQTVPVVGREGVAHRPQALSPSRPSGQSSQDWPEQPLALDQMLVHGFDVGIQWKHLQSQLGAPTLCTKSLAKVNTIVPVPEGDPRLAFGLSRFPLLSSVVREELDCHVGTERLQGEQDLPLNPQKPELLFPSAALQTPTPGEPLQGARDTEQPLELHTDGSEQGLPVQVPEPVRADSRPPLPQEIQETCVCPSESLPQKAPRATPSPEVSPASLVPTVAALLQDHVAEKCSEIQRKAFPTVVRESHRSSLLLTETSLARPLQPPGELGKGGMAAFPSGKVSSHPDKLDIKRIHLPRPRGQPTLYPEPPAKLPSAAAAGEASVKFSVGETDFLLGEVRENLDWHVQWKKLHQEWALPGTLWKSQPPAPKPSAWKMKPRVEVVPVPGDLLFLGNEVKKQLELHIMKMQVQQRWGLPSRVEDSRRRFMAPAPEEGGHLPHPAGGGTVRPYFSPYQPWSRNAGPFPQLLRVPKERKTEGARAISTDATQQLARAYSRKDSRAVALSGKETPELCRALQSAWQSTGSPYSMDSPTPVPDTTPEVGRSDGVAGTQSTAEPGVLLAEAKLASPPPLPGAGVTENSLIAKFHVSMSEVRNPIPRVDGATGPKETLELHVGRQVNLGEDQRPGVLAGEHSADFSRNQPPQVAPDAPDPEQLARSILVSLIAGQVAHTLQIKYLMDLAEHVPVGSSVCQRCRQVYPGQTECEKPQGETPGSGKLHSLRDIMDPPASNRTENSKMSQDQLPPSICKKCRKLRQKRPGGSAGADSSRRSQGVPQGWVLEDASSLDDSNKPVVLLLPTVRSQRQDGLGRRARTKPPKKVSIATSTTGLPQGRQETMGSADAAPPKAPRATTSPAPKGAVLKKILLCLKQTFSKLQSKVKSQMSQGSRLKRPDTKFTDPPFWKVRTSKGARCRYY